MFTSPSTPSSRRVTAIVCAVLCVVLSGCGSAVQVRHEEASSVSHGPYRSYALLQHPVGREESVDGIIEAAIHGKMQAKGYERTEVSKAELLVSYKVLLSGELAPVSPLEDPSKARAPRSTPDALWDVVWVSVPPAQGVSPRDPSLDKTLLVMLQEAHSYRVVWLGWSSTEVDRKDFVAVTKQAIDEIMARIPEVK